MDSCSLDDSIHHSYKNIAIIRQVVCDTLNKIHSVVLSKLTRVPLELLPGSPVTCCKGPPAVGPFH